MQYLRQLETKKLFYGKYLYKLVVENTLTSIFRSSYTNNSELGYAKQVLDNMEERVAQGKTLTKNTYRSVSIVSSEEFDDAKTIYSFLKNASDYRTRCEVNTLAIFSNDKSLLLKISDNLNIRAIEFWEPAAESVNLLTHHKNIKIVNKKPEYKYQIFLQYRKVDPNIVNWFTVNKDKVKVGVTTLRYFSKGYTGSSYIYVRDDRVLSLVQMLIGHAICKIDELVYKDDIDKYKYDNK